MGRATNNGFAFVDFNRVDWGAQLLIAQFARPKPVDGLPAQFAIRHIPFGQQQPAVAGWFLRELERDIGPAHSPAKMEKHIGIAVARKSMSLYSFCSSIVPFSAPLRPQTPKYILPAPWRLPAEMHCKRMRGVLPQNGVP